MSEYLKKYVEFRDKLETFAGLGLIISLILLAVAKSPDFAIKDFFGIAVGDFHNGYVAAYGGLIVTMIVFRYHRLLRGCLVYRERLAADLIQHSKSLDDEFPEAAGQLFRLPFWIVESRQAQFLRLPKWFKLGCVVAPSILLFVASGYFTYFYFRFYREGSPGTWIPDLFLGHPLLSGFRAPWREAGIKGSTIFLNAPYHTWLAIVCFGYAGFVCVQSLHYVFRRASPYRIAGALPPVAAPLVRQSGGPSPTADNVGMRKLAQRSESRTSDKVPA